jgi:hypothetical protein
LSTRARRPGAKRPRAHGAPARWTAAGLDKLIKDATTDCHDESEQRSGIYAALEEHVDFPFATEVLGVMIMVVGIDVNDAQDVVAVCTQGGRRQTISIVDLPLPAPSPRGAEWIEAYRRWASRR